MSIKIVVVTAKGRFEHEVDKNYISIGRSKDNDIIIDDLSVSRKHAILEKDETGKLYLTDLNSSNGTYINNIRIKEKTPVTSNDQILLGKATMIIEAIDSEDFQGTVRVDASKIRETLEKGMGQNLQEQPPQPPVEPAEPQMQPPVPPVEHEPIQTQPLPPQPPVEPQYQPQQTYKQPYPPYTEEPYRGNIVYGGILERFIALFVDCLIVLIPAAIVNWILGFILMKIGLFALIPILNVLINLGALIGYFTLAYSKYGTSIGKKLFKLYVVDQKKLVKPTTQQAIIRSAVQFLISGIFFIGYIMAFLNQEHTTLHDMLAKTYVIKK